MRPFRVLLPTTIVLLAGAAPAAADQTVKMSDVTIPASDGVNLVGDVYLPSAHGKFPAVVDMEPYGRSTATPFLQNGYAHVNTDVRGSGKSGGSLCLLCKREQQDVYEVVEWIAKQPWSDGKVALQGYSYSAITALLGAALEPPHLSAVIVGHPPTDPYRDVIWQNGLYNQGFVGQWMPGRRQRSRSAPATSRSCWTARSSSSRSRLARSRSTGPSTTSAPCSTGPRSRSSPPR